MHRWIFCLIIQNFAFWCFIVIVQLTVLSETLFCGILVCSLLACSRGLVINDWGLSDLVDCNRVIDHSSQRAISLCDLLEPNSFRFRHLLNIDCMQQGPFFSHDRSYFDGRVHGLPVFHRTPIGQINVYPILFPERNATLKKTLPKRSLFVKEKTLPKRSLFVKEKTLPKRKLFVKEKTLPKRKLFVKEKTLPKRSLFVEEKTLPKRKLFVKEKTLPKRKLFVKEKTLPKRSLFVKEKTLPKRKLFVKEKTLPKRKLFVKEKTLPKRSLFVKEKTLPKRKLFVKEKTFPKRKLFVKEKTLPKRKLFVKEKTLPKRSLFVKIFWYLFHLWILWAYSEGQISTSKMIDWKMKEVSPHVLDRWCGLLLDSEGWSLEVGRWNWPVALSCRWCQSQFDETLGFPGEGPWTLSTINVGSLEKHPEIFSHPANCIAIQETRVTQSNSKTCAFKAAEHDYMLQCGPLMPYLPSGHPAWGGVAISTEQGAAIAFDSSHDAVGVWPSLWASSRVCANWVAVSSSLTMLVFCIYCHSDSTDISRRNANNNLLQQIMVCASQFGQIPIAICGDFQDTLHNYPPLRTAFEKGILFDSLMFQAQDGASRPNTFSRNKDWKNNGISSIDGILLNQVAFQYLQHTKVCLSKGLQHAFVDATFDWPDSSHGVRNKGLRWIPHATFNLSNLTAQENRINIAETLWDCKYQKLCDEAASSQQMVDHANAFAIEVLLKSGATWNKGRQVRGVMPAFDHGSADHFPGHAFDSKTKHLNRMVRTLSRIDDLSYKLAHPSPTPNAQHIAKTIWIRISKVLASIDFVPIPSWPTQDDLINVWDAIFHAKEKITLEIRQQRAETWRKKMQNSALGDYRDVFRFLKLKHRAPVHALVTDASNMPIYHPADAMKFAREQWNPIFDTHKEHIPSKPLMDVVGPLLDNIDCPFYFDDICAEQLHSAIQQRPNEAAGGVDGWKTVELKALPCVCFLPWAQLWNKIEQDEWTLPDIFKIARLTMLPKPGAKTMQPIDRRLINLLNIHYLLWSKVRFQHLVPWQMQVIPANVCGGVKGRKTSDIAHHVAIRNELSLLSKQPIVGVKIDRSKCFDRVLVHIIQDIALRLGIPKRFLSVWMQVYKNFKRFLTVGCYIDGEPLSSSNGIAQGDSASVLAINLLMTGWSTVMKLFPHVETYVYIDDGYLIADFDFIDEICAAIHATSLFDQLAGQKFNPLKSSAWATSSRAKKIVAQKLPNIPIHDFFDVLGALVKSTSRVRCVDTKDHAEIIRQVLKDIHGLPLNLKQKSFLIGSKAISKVLYMPEISHWSRLCLDSFQSLIVSTLWDGRPSWKSVDLLFAVLTNPLRTHPQHAIAAQVIFNITSRCRQDNEFYQLWCRLCDHAKIIPKGIMDAVVKAMGVLKLRFVPPNNIQFLDKPMCFLDLTPRLTRKLLQVASMQSLYSDAIRSSRKDLLSSGTGILDCDLSTPREPRMPWKLQGLDVSILAGPLTGACQTANRLFKAGLLDTPKCRFCNQCLYEDIRHLATSCQGIRQRLGNPGEIFPDQPNFLTRGLFEIPSFVVESWKRSLEHPVIPPTVFQHETVRVWGDGSVYNGEHFYTRTLGCAGIGQQGDVIFSHGWHDPLGCSFKAEMRALLYSLKIFGGPLHFYTDCQSIVGVWSFIEVSDPLPDNLAYREDWLVIKNLAVHGHVSRLTLEWVRAHQVDRNGAEMTISQRNNKLADYEAKRCAQRSSPIPNQLVQSWKFYVRNQWIWLCKLTKLIQMQKYASNTDETGVSDLDGVLPDISNPQLHQEQLQFQNRFCKWDWMVDSRQYNWQMVQGELVPLKSWKFSLSLWNEAVGFFQQLSWRVGDVSTSIYTLAFLFWHRTQRVPPVIVKDTEGKFSLIVQWLRQVFKDLSKLQVKACPNQVTFLPRTTLFSSQFFPCGTFQGGRIWMSDRERLSFAKFVAALPSTGRSAKAWAVQLQTL